jgi:outer membrane beta-barrel protein
MHNFLLGLRMEFNFTDWFGLGILGYYGFNAPTKLTKHISESEDISGNPTTPTDSNWPSYTGAARFEDQVARLKGMYLAHLSFVPFRGKMSLFEKFFVAIDGSIFVGGGIVHFEERSSCSISDGASNPCGRMESPDVKRELQIGGTFTWGVNFMAYVNDFVAINIEFRMTPFRWNSGGTDESGQSAGEWSLTGASDNATGNERWVYSSSGEGDYPDGDIDKDDRKWNLNMAIGLGVIFYLPTAPSIGN